MSNPCKNCNGTGKVHDALGTSLNCPKCNGSGDKK